MLKWLIGSLLGAAILVGGPVEAGRGLVVCVDPIAARIGTETLEKGAAPYFVDYRETAPKLATAEMFLDDKGHDDPDKVEIGWLTLGVPGTVHGLWTAHQKGGRLPWRDLV